MGQSAWLPFPACQSSVAPLAVSNAGIRYDAHSAMNFTLPLARLPVTVNE